MTGVASEPPLPPVVAPLVADAPPEVVDAGADLGLVGGHIEHDLACTNLEVTAEEGGGIAIYYQMDAECG